MLKKVERTKRRMVTAVDPHLKKDLSHYKIYSAASRDGLLVKNKDGKEYEGWCWPGLFACFIITIIIIIVINIYNIYISNIILIIFIN